MRDYIFIDDFFLEDCLLGGGELNNYELIKCLEKKGVTVETVNSHLVSEEFIKSNIKKNFIISNFWNLRNSCMNLLEQKGKYIIYEHDHKYLNIRDPSSFENYIAPKKNLINLNFYKNAIATICQSKLHQTVIKKNLEFENIHSVGGNLWSSETLDIVEKFSERDKEEKYSIMASPNPIKNTGVAIKYCKVKEYEYELIRMMPHTDFLDTISKNKGLVFFPRVLETLNRVVIEARMMNCQVVTNKKVGATSEPWFSLKGKELISKMREKREHIPKFVMELFDNGK